MGEAQAVVARGCDGIKIPVFMDVINGCPRFEVQVTY